jgi:hypothetical protein
MPLPIAINSLQVHPLLREKPSIGVEDVRRGRESVLAAVALAG